MMDLIYLDISELKPYARNPRKNDHALQKMCSAISNFGFRVPILAKKNGEIVDGHLRIKAAKSLGITKIPVITCDDLSPAQIKCLRLSVNKIAEIADWDDDLLNMEIKEILDGELDLSMTSFDEKDFKDLLIGSAEDLDIDKTYRGQDVPSQDIKDKGTISLGNHKVMCGDSTQEEYYNLLLGETKADLVFIDPPYNANYQSRVDKDDNWGGIENDNMSDESYAKFLSQSFQQIKAHMSPKSSIYCCIDYKNYPILAGVFAEYFTQRSTIIWDKTSIGLGQYYRTQYEMILFGALGDKVQSWYGGKGESDVWSLKRDASNDYLHPTQKPVDLVKRALINSSKVDDVVLDVFGGSGTTLMACEELGRKAFIIEKETKYIDVICERFKNRYG